MSMRFFRKMLKERGWRAEKLCAEGPNNLILTRPDGRQVRVASSTPPTTSVFALRLADNKLMSYELLRGLGAPQPETAALRNPEEAAAFLAKYGKLVVKPADGAHGRGVTVGLTETGQLAEAIRKAEAASPELKLAIMQPQLPPDALEQRVICIGYKFVVAIARIPAQVTGDGEHTLGELIKLENTTLRAAPYQGELAWIDEAAAEKYLGEQIQRVPAQGERVRVVGTCNIGQGGTAEDRSGAFTPAQIELAERVARAAELPVVGIDFYGDQIIELNACPSLYYPTGDAAALKAIAAYIDYLETL